MNSRGLLSRYNALQIANFGFFGFVFLSLIQSWNDLSRLFLFALFLPAVIYSAAKGRLFLGRASPFWLMAAALCFYLFLSIVFLSESDEVSRYVRWLAETAIFVLGVFYIASLWRHAPLFYGAVFLAIAGVVSLYAVLGFHFVGVSAVNAVFPDAVPDRYGSRLVWLGILEHPIKGPSMVVVLYALGAALFLGEERRPAPVCGLWVVSTLATAALCLSTASRGPIVSLLVFVGLSGLFLITGNISRKAILQFLAIALGVVAAIYALYELFELEKLIEHLLSRKDGRRFELWGIVINHLPESVAFGCGMATEFIDCSVGAALREHFGRDMSHSHNLLLHAYVMNGLTGLVLLCLLLGALVWCCVFSKAPLRVRWLSLLLVMLTMLLTGSEGYRLISSPKVDWFVVWLPLMAALGLSVHGGANQKGKNGTKMTSGNA
ncbi:MAG: O-antigen ligase family protein [Ketobacteraceae bacterium]|nr:O-antigen ligase family protein [Ketobacteraceae bacterium]